jgi:small redox-active disulfide protein 2
MSHKILIEVLGPGCRNCELLYDNVVKVIEQLHLGGPEVQVVKVKDIDYFMKKRVFITPALVVDGQVLSTGRVLTTSQILDLLKDNLLKVDG